MKEAGTNRFRLFSGIIILAMVIMSIWTITLSPASALSALDDEVVNVTQGTGYGDDLQKAIDEADSGDVIEVYTGVYRGIEIGKSISLIAPDGPSSVTITRPESGTVNYALSSDARNVLIKGLTIESDHTGIEIKGLDEDAITIEDCVFNVDSYGIRFMNHLHDANIVIRNNTFIGNGYTYLVELYSDLFDSSVIIQGNSFEGFEEAITSGGNTEQGITENSSVVIEDNYFQDGNLAIYVTWLNDGSSAWILENEIESVDYGINIYDFGYESEFYPGPFDPCTLIIEGNILDDISYYGIALNELYNGSIAIVDNEILNCGVHGIYLDRAALWRLGYPLVIEIENNLFMNCGEEAFYIAGMDLSEMNTYMLTIYQNRFIGNVVGIYFDEIDQGSPESFISIVQNSFIDNDRGLVFSRERYILDAEPLVILLNQFSGNGDFALFADDRHSEALEKVVATNNWWGDESGPVVKEPSQQIGILSTIMSVEPSGDPVNNNVDFDPWLASLSMAAIQDSMASGETQIITARVLDNEGIPVEADGLTIHFSITGAHILDRDVLVAGTGAVLNYPGSAVGMDTITAEVYIAGIPTGMTAEIEVEWTQPTATPTEPTQSETTPAAGDTGTGETEDTPPIPQTGNNASPLLFVVYLSAMFILILILRKRVGSKS